MSSSPPSQEKTWTGTAVSDGVAHAVVQDSAAVMDWVRDAQTNGVPAPDLLGHLPYGEHVRGWAGVRARKALERAGYKVPSPPESDGASGPSSSS